MPRAKKTIDSSSKEQMKRSVSDSSLEESEDLDLPSDEAGRLKIKKQYEELLGIRIDKLKGRVLNREKINKTVEGIYYICLECKRICHNLDEGLVQVAGQVCYCQACGKGKNVSVTG